MSPKILKVSDGLGSHLPGPSSAQVGPLFTIVPPGNKRASFVEIEPCSFF